MIWGQAGNIRKAIPLKHVLTLYKTASAPYSLTVAPSILKKTFLKMHQIIQFNQMPEQKHHKPANEVSKQQTTPKHPTTLLYTLRNQPATYNQQNTKQTSLCYLQKEKQRRQKRNYKNTKTKCYTIKKETQL